MDLTFRLAESSDCAELARLINSAYRGEGSLRGWTTESHLLDGLRTDEEDLIALLSRPHSNHLMAFAGDKIVGTVHLEKREHAVCYLGMFTVDPNVQARGLGKSLLTAAEQFGRELYQAKIMQMTVITLRHELLSWYERRGYQRTGRHVPFPVHEKFGLLKVPKLEMEVLEKSLT